MLDGADEASAIVTHRHGGAHAEASAAGLAVLGMSEQLRQEMAEGMTQFFGKR